MVPMPSEVKTSRSSEWGWRPSMTCACGTPPWTARMHASSLGIMPASTRAEQLLGARDGQRREQRVAVGPVGVDPLDVGEHDQLVRLERHGQRRGSGVGVDVEDLAVDVEVGGDGRHDGDPPGVEDVLHGSGVDRLDVADQAEVDLLAVDVGAATAGPEERGVLAGQPHGDRAVLVEQADELAADLAGEHHPDDVHHLGGGDPQAATELALQPEPVEHGGDLRPAAVHDDGAQAGIPEEGDVLGEGGLEGVVDHRVAAVLDDDERAAELLEPRQRLDEGLGLALGDAQRGGADVPADGVGGGRAGGSGS